MWKAEPTGGEKPPHTSLQHTIDMFTRATKEEQDKLDAMPDIYPNDDGIHMIEDDKGVEDL